MKLTRRRAAAAFATATTVALVAAGCSSGDSSTGSAGDSTATAASTGKVTLKMWGWATGMEDAIAQWNKENPNIQIEFYRESGDDGNKVPAAIESGTAPDIIQLDAHDTPNYVIKDYLYNITDYASDLKSSFTDAAWSEVSFDGSVYGMPQDVGPSALIYRKDIFEKYGLTPPTTWDEYVADAKKLHAADPKIYLGQFSPNETGFWMEQVIQAGGSWYGIDGDAWKVTVNDDASKKVAGVWQQLTDQKLLKNVEMWTPEYWKAVNDGQIASINYAAWFPALLKENAGKLKGKWSVAPSPTFDGQDTAGTAGGSIDAITSNSKHPAEAMKFLKWINTTKEGTSFLIKGGIMPASTTGLANADLITADPYFGGQKINEVFVDAAKKVPGTWMDGPTFADTQNALKDEFSKVANGEQTFDQALDNAAARSVDAIKALNLKVSN